ncbi:hypothetical protein ALC62_11550 [Cyphomyrmex costatus]|uniref:Retrotransposon gag domain-containing protein n=1 Tax=Cyphomyrmex costatus TaxID=456900 RepID=A0A151ICE1_9HYME|nr:hypothetical protein ALC62_11550 [Cyphomyrmex costatus]
MQQKQDVFEQTIRGLNQLSLEANTAQNSQGSISRQSSSSYSLLLAPVAPIASNKASINTQSTSTLATIPAAQAIKIMASQIPSFDGSEEEDVEAWIKRIDLVAQTHGVSDGVVLLAATSKLLNTAKDWYLMEDGPVHYSWSAFKEAIIENFKCYLPFRVVRQKVDSRRWNFGKESFRDYARNKLKLMHRLNLTEPEKIQFIIDGINSASLRATASALEKSKVADFLRIMSQVTGSFGSFPKKSSPPAKRKEKIKSSPPSPSKKEHSKTDKDEVCGYCKVIGHSKANCFKLKKKALLPTISTPVAVAATEEVESSSDEEPSVMAYIERELTKRNLETNRAVTRIYSINDRTYDPSEWADKVPHIQYVMNNTLHSSINSTPLKLLLEYDLRNHSDNEFVITLAKLATDQGTFDDIVINRCAERQLALETSERIKDYNKVYYDKKHKKPSKYKTGDFICIRDTVVKPGESRKLKPDYKGPYVIDKVLSSNRYVIKDIPGHNLSPGPYNSILSSDRIKAWAKPEITE